MNNQKICMHCNQAVPMMADTCPNCDKICANENPNGTLSTGALIGDKYTIGAVREIDGDGVLYEAFDVETQLPVLVKEYLPVTLCSKRDDEGNVIVKDGCAVPYKTTLVDFVDLFKELKRLAGRPGIMTVQHVITEKNTAYVAFEYKKSVTLTEWLNKQTDFVAFEESYRLLKPIMLALTAMHEIGLIHRGVSPDNINITPNGTTFLSGYGTLALRSTDSELNPVLYDGYSAPEQYSSTEFQGNYTDVFSFAAVMYKMAAGTAPQFDEEWNCQTLKQVGADVPTYISKAIDASMQHQSSMRTSSMGELRSQLDGTVKNSPARSSKTTKAANNANLKMIGICVAGVLVVVLILWFAIKSILPDTSSSSSSSSSEITSSSSEVIESEPSFGTAPDFTGKKYDDIENNPEYSEKYLFTVVEEYSDTYSTGTVIRQTPAFDEELPSSGVIQIVVSKGSKTVKMPNVVGYSTGDVRLMLLDAGITSQNFVTIANDGSYKAGQAVRTDKEVGSTINVQYDTVTVYFADVVITPPPAPTPAPPASSQPTITVSEA